MGWNGAAGIKLIYPAEARVNCFRHMYRFGIHLLSFISFAFDPCILTQPATVQLRLSQEITGMPKLPSCASRILENKSPV